MGSGLPATVAERYDAIDIGHALTSLQSDFPEEWAEICTALAGSSSEVEVLLEATSWEGISVRTQLFHDTSGIAEELERYFVALSKHKVAVGNLGEESDRFTLWGLEVTHRHCLVDVAVLIDYSREGADLKSYIRAESGGCPVLLLVPYMSTILGE